MPNPPANSPLSGVKAANILYKAPKKKTLEQELYDMAKKQRLQIAGNPKK